MQNNIYYFGTSLEQSGHFIFEVNRDYLQRKGIDFSKLPFYPENLPIDQDSERGHVEFHCAFGYSIIAIQGSCTDNRPGSKTIFWVNKNFSYEYFKECLLRIPIIQKIIEKMPFEVKWSLVKEQ